MKTPRIIAAAIVLSLGLSNVAIAQHGTYGHRDEGSRAEQREGHRGSDRAQERRSERRMDRRQDARRDAHEWRRDARLDERWDRRDPRWNGQWSRGAGPRHDFYRGGRLPPQYRKPVYVVNDWRGHRLHRPPPGYHWVQAGGGDYVLAAIATGVILSILLSH